MVNNGYLARCRIKLGEIDKGFHTNPNILTECT